MGVDTRTGSFDPLLDQDEAGLIKFWNDDIIKLVIRYERNILPERRDPEQITQVQEDMKRHIGANAPQFNKNHQLGSLIRDKELWTSQNANGYAATQVAEYHRLREPRLVNWMLHHNRPHLLNTTPSALIRQQRANYVSSEKYRTCPSIN